MWQSWDLGSPQVNHSDKSLHLPARGTHPESLQCVGDFSGQLSFCTQVDSGPLAETNKDKGSIKFLSNVNHNRSFHFWKQGFYFFTLKNIYILQCKKNFPSFSLTHFFCQYLGLLLDLVLCDQFSFCKSWHWVGVSQSLNSPYHYPQQPRRLRTLDLVLWCPPITVELLIWDTLI